MKQRPLKMGAASHCKHNSYVGHILQLQKDLRFWSSNTCNDTCPDIIIIRLFSTHGNFWARRVQAAYAFR